MQYEMSISYNRCERRADGHLQLRGANAEQVIEAADYEAASDAVLAWMREQGYVTHLKPGEQAVANVFLRGRTEDRVASEMFLWVHRDEGWVVVSDRTIR